MPLVNTSGSIPLPIMYFVVGISVVLNFAGLASIVGGFIVWADFIKGFIDLYDQSVRQPVESFLLQVWPIDWARPPWWSYDLMIIWGASFLGYRMSVLLDPKDTPFLGVLDLFGVFLIGPLVIPIFFGLIIFARKFATRVTERMFLKDPILIGSEYARIMERKKLGLPKGEFDSDKILSEFKSSRGSSYFQECVDKETMRIKKFSTRTLWYFAFPYFLLVGTLFISFQFKNLGT